MLTAEDYENPYILSRLAGCATPDNPQSPGAAFLLEVANAYGDARGNNDDGSGDTDDLPHEIADEVVTATESRGTHGLILAAVDLCAYREDVRDYTEPTHDAHHLLTLGLYVIAYNLVQALQTETDDA